MKTNYSQAWDKFLHSDEAVRLLNAMTQYGIKMPYRENILNRSWTAGWNASGVKIVITDPTVEPYHIRKRGRPKKGK